MEKKYHHGNLRVELINTGIKLLSEVGEEKFSLRELAKRVGVSHGAPYKHFSNKKDFIDQIIDSGMNEFVNHFSKPVDEKKSLEEQLVDLGVAYIDFGIKHPDLMKLLFKSEKNQSFKIDDVEFFGISYGLIPLEKICEEAVNKDLVIYKSKGKMMLNCIIHVHGLVNLIIEDRLRIKNKIDFVKDDLSDFVKMIFK